MTITATREATAAEIIHEGRDGKYRILFGHGCRETYNPQAKNGVSHRRISRSKLRVIDGKPHVRFLGELEPVRATYYTLDSGHEFVASIRLEWMD